MKHAHSWTANRFKRKLEQYDLTPEQGADLVGAKRRTGYYWSEHGPSYVVALVYELMERYNITPAELEEIGTQLTKKQTRGN